MDELKVYLNGEILPQSQAHIGIGDTGFLYGASVFTTMAAFNGRPFRLDRHLTRLLDTAAMLDLRTAPASTPEALTQACLEVLRANELERARMRITLTAGDFTGANPTTLVTAAPMPEYPRQWYEQGVMVVISSFKQSSGDPTFGYKTGCYFPRILARQEAQHKGAVEALWFTTTNRLAEGCFTNVFLVKDGVLRTPPRDTPVLPGVTRAAVLELAETLGIPADEENELLIDDLLGAEEVFITASTMGPMPVTSIERHVVGDGAVGPVTQQLLDAYWDLVETETAAS